MHSLKQKKTVFCRRRKERKRIERNFFGRNLQKKWRRRLSFVSWKMQTGKRKWRRKWSWSNLL